MQNIDQISPTQKRYLIIALELMIWAGSVFTLTWLWDKWYLTGPHGPYRWVGMDFIPYWVGCREMLAGTIPYNAETTLKIQQFVYGGPALGNDPMMFVYPAWIFLIIAPFALLPLKWAAALYCGTLMLGCFNLIFLLAAAWSGGHFYRRVFWITALTLGSLPFLVISVTKGQLGYLGLGALFVSRRVWERRPFLAGMLLGLAIIKPTVTTIPTAGLLLWALLEMNWKVLAGFSGCMLVLISTSMALVGNWFPEYFAMLQITGGMPVFWSMTILPMPWPVFYALSYLGLAAYAFSVSFKSKNSQAWFSALVLCGIALTPMRWIYDLFLGILVPPGEEKLSGIPAIGVGVAVLSPWLLAFIPETIRWNSAAIGLPVIWAIGFIAYSLVKSPAIQPHQP